MALNIPSKYPHVPSLDKRIRDAYINKNRHALFSIMHDSDGKGILFNVLKYLESLKIASRKKWIAEVEENPESHGIDVPPGNLLIPGAGQDYLDAAIRALYEANLRLTLGVHGDLIERSANRVVLAWDSECDVIHKARACPDLPAKEICYGAYHKPYEVILKRISSWLWFNRDYSRLRPYCGDRCIEIITYGGLLVKYKGPDIPPGSTWQGAKQRSDDERLPEDVIVIPPPQDYGRQSWANPDIEPVSGGVWWESEDSYEFTDSWVEYPPVGDRWLPITSFVVRSKKPNERFFVLWAENRDEWVVIPHRTSPDGKPHHVGPPKGTVVHYIPDVVDEIFGDTEEGYQRVGEFGAEILKAFGIFPGDLTPLPLTTELACVTHPIKLAYLARHKDP